MSLYVPPLFPAEVIDKGGQVYNVKAYGAKGDGISDDTAAFQAAIDAAAATNGIVEVPAGIYIIESSATDILTVSGNVLIRGAGVGNTIIRVASGSVTTGATIFNLSGTYTFGFDGFTLDGQGSTQNWASSGTSNYYKGISADGNGSGGSGTLLVGTVEFLNIAMNAANPQGLCVNTFGCPDWTIGTLLSENCDTTLFITQTANTVPNRGRFERVIARNHTAAVVIDEGTGDWDGGAIIGRSDALVAGTVGADALRIETQFTVSHINLGLVRLENGRYPVLVGAGNSNHLTASSIKNGIAFNCRGSFNLGLADETCVFGSLVADTCAIGGVSGATVFASFEVGASGVTAPSISEMVCLNSQNQAIQFNGPAVVKSGSISGGTTTVTTTTGAVMRNVLGYNPVGLVTVAVPATGAATAALPYDATFYITASTSTVACAVTDAGGTSQTVATIPASGFAGVFVPAGSTLTPTYTAAPTWTVFGN